MAREWTLNHGLPGYDLLEIIENALTTQAVLASSATRVVIGDDTYKVVFKGSFTDTGGDPAPDFGFVNSIKVFAGAALVGKATGYNMTVAEIGDGMDDLGGGDFSTLEELFFLSAGPRIIINGSGGTEALLFGDGVPKYTLRGNGGQDILQGGLNDDKIFSGRGIDSVSGHDGDDLINGGRGNDFLQGGLGNDLLRGGRGSDMLFGVEGNDVLIGGTGGDFFAFVTVPLGNLPGQAGVDDIRDFKPGVDTIALDDAVFAAIGPKLNKGEFHKGPTAQNANDFILYNAGNGALFYDANGNGAGGRTKFAEVDPGTDLSHTDFLIV